MPRTPGWQGTIGRILGLRRAADTATDGTEQRGGAYEGQVDEIASGVVIDWVRDTANPLGRVRLRLDVDGSSVGEVLCDGFRRDLEQAGIGDGRHAFVFALPEAYRDGKPHVLE